MDATEAHYKIRLMQRLAGEGERPIVLLLMFLYLIAPQPAKFQAYLRDLKTEFMNMKM